MPAYRNEINVMFYGAVGDGVTNDSPAFDAALLAMQNEGSSRGNKLIIPNGTYRLTHELLVDCDCIIQGSGTGQESAGTILRFWPDAHSLGNHGIIVNSRQGSATNRSADWTIIRDLTIQASDMRIPGRHGLIARSRCKIENVIIFWFGGNGIHIVTGDGNNSDGNTIWHPNRTYTVGDWVKEPGYNKRLLPLPVTGTLTLVFNPRGSGDLNNIYDVSIEASNRWLSPPVKGDLMIIPSESVLAGTGFESNAGLYLVDAVDTSHSFRAHKQSDDPYTPSNGMMRNPVSINPGVPIISDKDVQIFTNLGNRYCCSRTGESASGNEGPGELRLKYNSPIGSFADKTFVLGQRSGASADIVSYTATYLVIKNSDYAFETGESLLLTSTRGFITGVGAVSGEYQLQWAVGQATGRHTPGTTISNNFGLSTTILSDDGNVLVITPPSGVVLPPNNIFQRGQTLTFFDGQNSDQAIAIADSQIVNGTQYHSTTPGYMAINYTGAMAGTHTGDRILAGTGPDTVEGIIGYDNGTTIIFNTTAWRQIRSGETITFIKPSPNTGTTNGIATTDQYTPGHGLSDGADGTTEWFSQGNEMGNANNWMVEYCRVVECEGHCLYIEGDKVNAGTSINFDASVSKGGWGIYDKSFLGNTHIGAHAAANAKGAYRTSHDGSARNVFIGCYSEGDYSPPSKIYNPGISLGGLLAGGFAADSSGFRLEGTFEGPEMSSHFVKKTYHGKVIRTTMGRASEGAQLFGGIEFTHTDDASGFLMGGYNESNSSWTFSKTNYPPSFEVLGGIYSNIFRPSAGLVIPAGTGFQGQAGQFPGVFIAATNGYPLLGNTGSNSFYPGTLILNQKAAAATGDKSLAKGWICTQKCGSGRAWSKWEVARDPYYAGATITPSKPNGFVYKAAIAGPASGGVTEPAWPTDLAQFPPVPIPDGTMIWELFGFDDKGLEEIVTWVPNSTPVITTDTNITIGEDLDITGQPFQKFGLTTIISGNTGVKFFIPVPNSNNVRYFVQCTIQTFGSNLNAVIANVEPEPGNTGNLLITIMGNTFASIDTSVAWLLKWSL